MTAHVRTPTTDIRKRMDDVYNEMEQSSRGGRLRMPVKFINFHQTDVLYQFTRAAVGYALAYVKVKTLEQEHAERASAEELAKLHASQLQNQFHHPHLHDTPEEDPLWQQQQQQQERAVWLERLRQAVDSQGDCASLLAETYARLVLHCSNFEHHKEDERLFECIYYFVCAVVKVGLTPDHWVAVENELGFLFRGAQFCATVKLHTASTPRRDPTTRVAATVAVSEAASASKKIQSLTAGGATAKDHAAAHRGDDSSLFVLPDVPTTRCCFFPASLPVGKIVSELDAAKLRATRNVEISQAIRDRIRAVREEESQRRRLDAIVSPRVSVRLDHLKTQAEVSLASSIDSSATTSATGRPDQASPLVLTPQQPRRRPPAHAGGGSPRLSMKATFTARSPAVNHLLPGTEDRVRLALEEYERSFQQKLLEQKRRELGQRHQQLRDASSSSDLSSSTSTLSSPVTPTKKTFR